MFWPRKPLCGNTPSSSLRVLWPLCQACEWKFPLLCRLQIASEQVYSCLCFDKQLLLPSVHFTWQTQPHSRPKFSALEPHLPPSIPPMPCFLLKSTRLDSLYIYCPGTFAESFDFESFLRTFLVDLRRLAWARIRRRKSSSYIVYYEFLFRCNFSAK